MLRRPYTLAWVVLVLLVGAMDTIAQNESVGQADLALVHPFDRKELGGGLMTTDIAVQSNSFVVAANQSGVLLFDGGAWELLPVPNRGVARSVLLEDTAVWVGGQGFLGRLKLGQPSVWEDFSGAVRRSGGAFADVWRLAHAEDGAFFGTSEYAGMASNNGQVEVLLEGPLKNSFAMASGFAAQRHDVLHVYDVHGDEIRTERVDPDWRVMAFLPDRNLLVTHAHGVFKWADEAWQPHLGALNDALLRARVNAIEEQAGTWFIGTVEEGIFQTGDWETVAGHYGLAEGLSGTSVLELCSDASGNLWSAGEGAVNVIRFSWPQRVPSELAGSVEPGYTSLHLPDGSVYWGTSHGLRRTAGAGKPAEEVPGLEGQIWSLQSFGDRPWVNHLNGAGWLNGDLYEPVMEGIGVWELVEQPQTGYHYAGTFQGLYRVDLKSVEPPVPVTGFSESSRFVVFESERVAWVAHPYKGAFRLQLDATGKKAESVRLYAGAEGFPEPVHVEVLQVGGSPLFSTNDGFYRFNAKADRMEPASDAFEGLIPKGGHVQRLYEGEHATWWFLQDQSVGQIHPHTTHLNASMAVRSVPLTGTPMVEPFERLEILSENEVCVPVESGFLYLDATRMSNDATPPAVDVHSVLHLNDASANAFLDLEDAQLPPGNHALEIRLRGFDARYVGIQRYQWRLEGTDSEWSRPQESARITLGGLGPGTHRVAFRSYVAEGFTGPSTWWTVRVAPPWYERWDVRIFLLLVAAAAATFAVIRKQRAIRATHARESAAAEKQRKAEAERYRRDLESSELRLEAERLRRVEAEMAAKNQELASATMHLVQKAQMASTLKSGLQSLREHLDAPQRKQVDRLLGVLGDGARLDDNWEQFTQQFDRVHVEFHQRLLDRFPELTKNDLKLCTYLRMNLSSKEIASLTFVTVRAVEVSRSRLRKRLGLDPGENLLQFIQSL